MLNFDLRLRARLRVLHLVAVCMWMWRMVSDAILYFIQFVGACLFRFDVPQVPRQHCSHEKKLTTRAQLRLRIM